PITATAILHLVQEDKIALDTQLESFYPESNIRSITVLELLNHTSGLPQDLDTLESYDHMSFSHKEVLKLICEVDNQEDVRGKFQYSNIGYFLLGDIIQKVSGLAYDEYLRKNVLNPSGMTGTYVDDPKAVIQKRAMGYDDGEGESGYAEEVVADYINPLIDLGNGSLLSTTNDLFSFYKALSGGEVLSNDILDKAWKNYGNNYGLGWWVYQGDNKMIMHSGNISGFTSCLIFYPELDFCIVMLANTSNVNGQSIGLSIRNIYFGRDYYQPKIRESINSFEFSEKLNGSKFKNPYFTLSLKIEEGRLFVQTPGDPWEELFAETPLYYFSKLHDFRLTFEDEDFKNGKLFFGDLEVDIERVTQ
ncbi:MAG: serine hydrolase domain-containing protein, partial [Cyclobacteriaceae bacterium]